jgi:hypothetical protein
LKLRVTKNSDGLYLGRSQVGRVAILHIAPTNIIRLIVVICELETITADFICIGFVYLIAAAEATCIFFFLETIYLINSRFTVSVCMCFCVQFVYAYKRNA